MKHSARAVAKLARERDRQARRDEATATSARPPEATPARSAAARSATAATTGQSAAARSATAATTGQSAGAAPGSARLAALPYTLVLVGVVVGLVLMRGGAHAVKSGTLVVAGALLAGSLARLTLPDGKVGLLGSRRRLIDVAMFTALGVGLLIAGLIVRVPG